MATVSPNRFDDILGGEPSALDRLIIVTTFPDATARSRSAEMLSLREFAGRVHERRASSKSGLPLLKLAKFGDVPTTAGSFRHDANVLAIDGIEGDYDGGRVSLREAADMLRRADLAATLYSTPSHRSNSPRWRVLCPLAATAAPDERERFCARLNGALGGILSPESFALSQAYYFGAVEGGSAPETVTIDGRAIDVADDLDAGALDRRGEAYRPPETLPATSNDDDEWGWRPEPDWDRIDAALAAIPVTDADAQETGGRDMWLRVGLALHQSCGGSDEGLARWDAWSRGGAKYDARVLRQQWRSLGRGKGRRVGIGSLFELAKSYGWSATVAASSELDAIDAIGTDGPSAKVVAATLQFLTPAECEDSPRRGYVVKGLVAPGDLACVFGAPGAGKSLIAPHIGYAVAQGRTAFGMRTKPGGVFYIAAEDPSGMRGRVTALRRRHGDAAKFIVVEGVTDLLVEGSRDVVALRDAAAEHRPALIFLDTLAMAFPGLEENSAEAMGKVVAIGRSLTKHGAAVVLIHHDTKAQGPTPRGHSLLNGALDVALQLFPRGDDGIIRAKLTKNRNGSCDRDIAFRIATEVLGEDEDGDCVTAALVCELAPGDGPRAVKLTKSQRAAMAILDALSTGGTVTEDAWRTACIEGRTVSAAEDRESRRKATKRAFEELGRAGVIVISDGEVRRPGHSGDSAFDED